MNVKKIIPRLWLSGVTVSRDHKFLEKNNIKYVLNMCEDWEITKKTDVEYCTKYSCYDTIDTILPLKETNEWLKTHHKDTKDGVLVHCIAGRNRSLSVVIGYLMMTHEHSYESAIKVTGKQPENSGFVVQLKGL